MNVMHGPLNKLVHVEKSTTVEACRGMGTIAAGMCVDLALQGLKVMCAVSDLELRSPGRKTNDGG